MLRGSNKGGYEYRHKRELEHPVNEDSPGHLQVIGEWDLDKETDEKKNDIF